MTTNNSSIASPCNSTCRISSNTGYCEGCFRTIDEIVAWGQMTNDVKVSVTEQLLERKLQHAA